MSASPPSSPGNAAADASRSGVLDRPLPHIRTTTSINPASATSSTATTASPPATPTTRSRRTPLHSNPAAEDSSSKHTPSSPSIATKTDSSSNFLLGVVFATAVIVLVMLFSYMPKVEESDKSLLAFPRSLSDVRTLSGVLRKYRDENMGFVVAGFCAIYIFLQAFAIPGAIFLSILAGPLFGTYHGLFLVSLVATSGSSVCFLISKRLGRGLVERCFPALLHRFRTQIQRRRGNLFFYLLFLRISPLLPNWFISISSPILDIPYHTFAAATFLGLIPANYLHVTTGIKLEELGSSADGEGSAVNYKALAFLFGIAFLALIPTIFKRKFEEMDANGVASAAPNQVQEREDAEQGSGSRSSKKKKIG